MPTTTRSTPTLLQGTLDMMVLAVLRQSPGHGYAIARTIERRANGELAIEEGSLYPALKRLAGRGEIAGQWGDSGTGRRARIYRLTPAGKRALADQEELWRTVSRAVNSALSSDISCA